MKTNSNFSIPSNYSMDEISEDILDIIIKNTNTNMILTHDENAKEYLDTENQAMIHDMELYNDENYSNDIKELKSIYPDIINFYLPNKIEMIKNISKSNRDIEINDIISSKSLSLINDIYE